MKHENEKDPEKWRVGDEGRSHCLVYGFCWPIVKGKLLVKDTLLEFVGVEESCRDGIAVEDPPFESIDSLNQISLNGNFARGKEETYSQR